jgi:pimeloyl-ACP methyl ester carboxylesterase
VVPKPLSSSMTNLSKSIGDHLRQWRQRRRRSQLDLALDAEDVSAPLEITGRRTVAGIRGAALKVYAGAPHGVFITHAKQVNQDILSFLAA